MNGQKTPSNKEMLEFIQENLWYLQKLSQEKGNNTPTRTLSLSSQDSALAARFWAFWDMKKFLEGEYGKDCNCRQDDIAG